MTVTLQSCFRYWNHLHDYSAAVEEHNITQLAQYSTHNMVQCSRDMYCCPTAVCSLSCRFHEYAAGHSAAELVSEQERASIASKLVQQHKEQQAAQEAAAAEAAAAAQAAEQNAATAAQAAGNTDTAQAMDTTADGDDAFDATAQETVAAAGHMMANIDAPAPAAATTADSSAADDAPVAEAGPDASNPIPSMPTVPMPDDIAATVMAGAAAAATGSDVPTAAAPLSVPPASEASFPASAPPAGFALTPPQAYPTTAAGLAIDTETAQGTIPQSDGPGDDPMDEAAAAAEAAAAPAPAAFTDPSSAASGDTSVIAGYAVADPAATPLATGVGPMQTSADPALQAAAPGTEAAIVGMTVPEAPQAAVPATAEELITDEQIKAVWLTSVDEVYTVTKEEWYRRKPFEDAIKRPYFHVKPLDSAQLQNWSR